MKISVEFLFSSSVGDGPDFNSGSGPARAEEIRLKKLTVKARRRLFISFGPSAVVDLVRMKQPTFVYPILPF